MFSTQDGFRPIREGQRFNWGDLSVLKHIKTILVSGRMTIRFSSWHSCCTRAWDEVLKWLNVSQKLPLAQEPREKVIGLEEQILMYPPTFYFLKGAKSSSQILGSQ